MDDAQLRTVWQQRQINDTFVHLSQPMSALMKHRLAKKVRQLSQLAEIWDEVIPDEIREHTALESLSSGVLTVMVDSAAHRYELTSLLNGGLRSQIQAMFGAGLDRIRLVPGQFFAVDLAGMRRYEM
jgi:hypothetical protein